MTNTSFVLSPISSEIADQLRAGGGPVYVAQQVPGYPCRQCLRDAAVGEELILVSHDPFEADSAYHSASPIFLHREPCTPDDSAETLPVQLTGRQLSVRSFDEEEMMIDAAVIDGTDLQGTIERLFGEDASAKIHVHNAVRGCWAVTVDRSSL